MIFLNGQYRQGLKYHPWCHVVKSHNKGLKIFCGALHGLVFYEKINWSRAKHKEVDTEEVNNVNLEKSLTSNKMFWKSWYYEKITNDAMQPEESTNI